MLKLKKKIDYVDVKYVDGQKKVWIDNWFTQYFRAWNKDTNIIITCK